MRRKGPRNWALSLYWMDYPIIKIEVLFTFWFIGVLGSFVCGSTVSLWPGLHTTASTAASTATTHATAATTSTSAATATTCAATCAHGAAAHTATTHTTSAASAHDESSSFNVC